MTTGGTMTGNIVFGDNNKLQLGGTTTNLEIYNDGTKSYITENATGNLIIKATDFEIHDGGGQTMVSFDADGSLRLYDQSATNGLPVQRIGTNSVGVTINGQTNTTSLKFGNETVIVSSVKDEDDMVSDSVTALATQQSIKKYVDDSVPTSVANATNATNVNLTNLANNSTDTGPKYLSFADGNSGNQPLETSNHLYYNPSTTTLTTKNIEVQSGVISGPSVMIIDPHADDTTDVGSTNTGGTTDDTGEVVILGDLRVTGTTTTLDSQTVTTGDSIIRLNADLPHSTSAADGGFHVYRGQIGGHGSSFRTNAKLMWDESESSFRVDQATGVLTTLLTAANWGSTYTGVVDGGTF